MKSLDSLCRPDQYGNYWFGSPARKGDTGADDKKAPATFRLLAGAKEDCWIVSLGVELGMVCDGAKLKTFASPDLALKEIRRILNKVR